MRTRSLALLLALVQVFWPVMMPSPAQARQPVSFIDVTEASGLPIESTHSWGAVTVDYDRDGQLDVLLNRHFRAAKLFEYRESRFEDITPPSLHFPDAGRMGYDRHHCAWGEADGNGRIDLYCLSGAQRGTGTGSNQLLLQTDNGLENAAAQYGVRDEKGRGRSFNWLDYDGDEDLDLFVGNTLRGDAKSKIFRNDRGSFATVDVGVTMDTYVSGSATSDWDNDGDTDLMVFRSNGLRAIAFEDVGLRFQRVALRGLTTASWRSGAFGDFDGDGWTDLQVTSSRWTLILRNRRGSFSSVGQWRLTKGRMSGWLDVENDGDLDAAVVDGRTDRDLLLVNRRGRFTIHRKELPRYRDGSGDGLAVTDFDRDGRVDVLVTNGFFSARGRPQLAANRTPSYRWIAARLHGTDFNPLGFGARIRVTARSRLRRLEVTDGTAGSAQHDIERLHFGIGAARRANVMVRWREGGTDCVTVRSGHTRDVFRGQHPC